MSEPEYTPRENEDILGKEYNHDSWGLLQISRVSGAPVALFGSGINPSNTIRLRINRACNRRSLNSDWPSKRVELIEIEMSPVQWAEAISHMNHGDGTPVTILRVNGQDMPVCPETNKRQELEDEFRVQMHKIGDAFAKYLRRLERSRKRIEKRYLTALTAFECKSAAIHRSFIRSSEWRSRRSSPKRKARLTHFTLTQSLVLAWLR